MRTLLLTLLILVLPAVSQAAPSGYVSRVMAFEPDETEASVIVKPLDDPANPYKDQYSAFDRWSFEHYNRSITPQNDGDWQLGLSDAQGVHPLIAPVFLPGPNDEANVLRMASSTVDDGGYMIPHYDYVRKAIEDSNGNTETLKQAMDRQSSAGRPQHTKFWSLGYMDHAIRAEIRDAGEQYMAVAYPKIPDWVAAKNEYTVFLPDNSVVLIESQTNAEGQTERVARRFDTEGKLLSEAPMPDYSRWQLAISPLADLSKSPYYREEVIPLLPHGETKITNNQNVAGRYEVLSSKEGTAVIDYWENKTLTSQDGSDPRDLLTVEWPYFNRISPELLAAVYAAQQKYPKQQ